MPTCHKIEFKTSEQSRVKSSSDSRVVLVLEMQYELWLVNPPVQVQAQFSLITSGTCDKFPPKGL